MMASNFTIETGIDYSWMPSPDRERIQELQAKVAEILPALQGIRHFDDILNAAAAALGNDDERYCQIYVCENCRQLYHADYSTNSDEDHDFCGGDCEAEFRGYDTTESEAE